MKTDPILEELWRIKEDLAREADYDVRRLCENTRRWAATHPHSGPMVKNAEDLRRFIEEDAAAAALILHENPRQYGEKKRD